MTADELIDKSNEEIGGGFTRFGVRLLMKEYARQKCKDQKDIHIRELTLKMRSRGWDKESKVLHSDLVTTILNAPEPEFD